ncbi:MAG TPA: amidohydrolase family protein [Chthonomonadaceae bacterium]|nr:amidohydrolase family protein [Chthonomonadaceae bacterium]
MDLSAIPLFDHHCHALRRPGLPLDGLAFRRHFSESADPEMAAHLPFSLFYARALRDLAVLLDCEPEEESVVAARSNMPLEAYARHLFEAAKITALVVDTGFRSVENYRLDEQRAFLPCSVHEALRLETLTEQLIVETQSFSELEAVYRAALENVRSRGIVAFKSIAAYRGGLQVNPRSRAEAEAVYPALKAQAQREGKVRLEERALLEYLLRIGLDQAASQDLPVQFHTGFGDPDLDLRAANPLHLRSLLEDPALRGVRFVLLHTYPFCREAGYLASVYSHVYADLSLTIPFAAHGGAEAIKAVLELAPTSKLLLSTDAFSIPELFHLGALYARESLGMALSSLQAQGWMTAFQAEHAAQQMLYGNAASLYGVN